MGHKYITTPIYYVNGDPHIGHAHTTVMGDILKRYHQMLGDQVLYSTGTDEHGQKNQEAIERSGMSPDEYLSRQSRRFRDLFDRLDVSYDIYVRTTSDRHKKVVQQILSELYARDLIYKKNYSGMYCVGCEQFKKATDLDSDGRCPDHLVPPVEQTETNYFFKQSLFQSWLIDSIESQPDLIRPEFYRKEILSMLKEPLEDLCISRPKSRVWLGIELPFDTDYVSYIWFDALINYISNLGYKTAPQFNLWWSNSTHIMAKDIIKTHIIYWPIMLHAMGIAMPHQYRIHGYWIGEGGQKMSKTVGNVVEPNEVVDLVGADAMRYYLAKNMGVTDSPISLALVSACYNTDLANNLGNLHSRVVKFVKKRFDDRVPNAAVIVPEDAALMRDLAEKANQWIENIDLNTISEAARGAMIMADQLNLYYNDMEPWKLANDENAVERYHSVMYTMLDCLRILFEFLHPIMPGTSRNALISIGAEPMESESGVHRFEPEKLGMGQPLGPGDALFPRLN